MHPARSASSASSVGRPAPSPSARRSTWTPPGWWPWRLSKVASTRSGRGGRRYAGDRQDRWARAVTPRRLRCGDFVADRAGHVRTSFDAGTFPPPPHRHHRRRRPEFLGRLLGRAPTAATRPAADEARAAAPTTAPTARAAGRTTARPTRAPLHPTTAAAVECRRGASARATPRSSGSSRRWGSCWDGGDEAAARRLARAPRPSGLAGARLFPAGVDRHAGRLGAGAPPGGARRRLAQAHGLRDRRRVRRGAGRRLPVRGAAGSSGGGGRGLLATGAASRPRRVRRAPVRDRRRRALSASRPPAAGAVLRQGGDRRRADVRAGADRLLPGRMRLRPSHRARLGRSVSARQPGGARSRAAGVRSARGVEPAGPPDPALRGGRRAARRGAGRHPGHARSARRARVRDVPRRPTPSAGSPSSFSAAIPSAAWRSASRRRSGCRSPSSPRWSLSGRSGRPPAHARFVGIGDRGPRRRERIEHWPSGCSGFGAAPGVTRSARARPPAPPPRSAWRSARRGAHQRGRG